MRLLKRPSTLYTGFIFLSVRVYVIRAILVCLSITLVILAQAQAVLECHCAVQGWKQKYSLTLCSSGQYCLSGHFAPFLQLYSCKQYCLLGCFALFQQQSVQLQIVLFIRSLCFLPIIVCVIVSNIVYQVALLSSYTGGLYYCKSGYFVLFLYWQFVLLYIRSLCSLSSLVVCTVVSWVALLPFYNSKAIVSSLCSLPVPILFQFILIYLNLF